MGKLTDKIAVISGGTSGIGLAIAKRFVKEGAHVFIFGRRREALDEAVQLIGANVTAIRADASKLEDLDRVADAVRSAKGKMDVVVSNAALVEQVPLPEITPDHYDRTFALNAKAPLFLVQKMLIQGLKELEKDGVVKRKDFREVPPRVEYSLAERGVELANVLRPLCEWGAENFNEQIAAPQLETYGRQRSATL